ncbi:hypothetical protein N9K16_04015, partial [Alphaproteobacteria bacterium]|nr:hypothetical protein [Alphaproteobacteria bacterium]
SSSLENNAAEADNREVNSDDVAKFLLNFTAEQGANIDEETIKSKIRSFEETAREEIMAATS